MPSDDDMFTGAGYPSPFDNDCDDCGHTWRSRGVPAACPECGAEMPDNGTCIDVFGDLRGLEPEVGADAVSDLEREMEARLESESSVPESLEDLVDDLQDTEDTPDRTRSYDTSGEPEYDYKRGRYWQVQREKAIERDNRRCQDCGLSRAHHQEYYGHDFVVHHIVPEREFETAVDAHALENLITICASHHQQLERMGRRELMHRTDYHDWLDNDE
ncbi:HNH endonuclease [Natrinema thermotolerans]|uniref:HNH endonuclease n=1 Tax=Natrinema thermotolerans TaxID=121872 RepID=UPI0006799543|nr:HNH endonuclease [Natrinema thermotolerans]QCC57217.1 hypothetical protein DVR14_00660 [Natrinema thermotolerans]